VIRGTIPLRVECAPAFNYARDSHTASIISDDTSTGNQQKVLFKSQSLSLDLRYVAEGCPDSGALPDVDLDLLDLRARGHLGLGAYCELNLVDGQSVTFIVRMTPEVEFKMINKPSLEKAEKMGVPLDRT
jgi:hypothetical protein